MSRARDHTTVHVTADDLSQAVDDLQADWGVERHQRWVSDTTARPGTEPPVVSSIHGAETTLPTAPSTQASRVHPETRLAALERDFRDLHAGVGRWTDTVEGAAARQLHSARNRLDQARSVLAAPTTRRRDRRAAAKSLNELHATVANAEQRWNVVGRPTADELSAVIDNTRDEISRLEGMAILAQLDQLAPTVDRTPGRSLGIER